MGILTEKCRYIFIRKYIKSDVVASLQTLQNAKYLLHQNLFTDVAGIYYKLTFISPTTTLEWSLL